MTRVTGTAFAILAMFMKTSVAFLRFSENPVTKVTRTAFAILAMFKHCSALFSQLVMRKKCSAANTYHLPPHK